MWAARIWLVRGKAREDGSGVVGRGQVIQDLLPIRRFWTLSYEAVLRARMLGYEEKNHLWESS